MSTAVLPMDGAVERPTINPWIIALAATLATFMEVLEIPGEGKDYFPAAVLASSLV